MNIKNLHSKIKQEEQRNLDFLHLTANEPLMSDAARAFMSSRLSDRLFNNKIAVNFDDLFDQGIFIRLGTQELTRRGMKEAEMKQIADFLDRSVKGENLNGQVTAFVNKYQRAHYSFDKF